MNFNKNLKDSSLFHVVFFPASKTSFVYHSSYWSSTKDSQIQRFPSPSDDPICFSSSFQDPPEPPCKPSNFFRGPFTPKITIEFVSSLKFDSTPHPKKKGSHFYNDPYLFFFSCRRQAEKQQQKKILRPRDIPVTLQAEIQKLLLDPGHQDPSVPLRTCCTSPKRQVGGPKSESPRRCSQLEKWGKNGVTFKRFQKKFNMSYHVFFELFNKLLNFLIKLLFESE